jgi:cytoskeleton protein RodZ
MGAPDNSNNGTAAAEGNQTQGSQTQGNQPQGSQAGTTPGQILRAARLRRGLAIQDVARQLRLSVRQVTALEEDDYSKLSSGTFLRGFVRNYSKLLQIDPQPLLRQLEESLPPPQPQTISYQIEGIPFPTGRNQGARNIIVGVLVAAALSLLVYEIYRGNETNVERRQVEVKTEIKDKGDTGDTSPADAPQSTPEITGGNGTAGAEQTGKADLPSSNALPNAVAKAAEPTAIIEGKSAIPVPAAPVPTAPPPPAVSKPGPKPTDAVPSNPLGGNAVAPNVAAIGETPTDAGDTGDVLRLAFEGESWVEIKDGRGKLLLSRLNPPGTQQVLRGKRPFSLTIGNAAQVKLVYNNKPVDLARYTNVYGGTARLSLE